MGDQDHPRQYRASRRERNSIILEDRISLGQKQIPRSPLSFPFFPSFLPSTNQPPASSRTAHPLHGIPHFLYLPAFLTTPRFAPVTAALAERMKATRRLLLKLGKLRVQFFTGKHDRHRFPPFPGCWIPRELNCGDCTLWRYNSTIYWKHPDKATSCLLDWSRPMFEWG